jgi:hypothetical protein
MVLVSAILSRSVRFFVSFKVVLNLALYCSVVILSTSSCSGASTIYVQPNIVSGRVVKLQFHAFLNIILAGSVSSKFITAPSERPIQFFWISFR